MDKMRWRCGDTCPVVAAVTDGVVIEIGDMVWLDGSTARPFNDCHDVSLFRDHFLGVAMQRSVRNCTAPIRVATAGTFEFDCDPSQRELGGLVGAKQNQFVTVVGNDKQAIGRVAKYQHEHLLSTVFVTIKSKVMG